MQLKFSHNRSALFKVKFSKAFSSKLLADNCCKI